MRPQFSMKTLLLVMACVAVGCAMWIKWYWGDSILLTIDAVANAYRQRGSRVLHTATSGAVRVSIADGEMNVSGWRDGEE